MKGKQLIIGVIFLILLGGGGYLFLNNSSKPSSQQTENSTSKKEETGIFNSIKDALSKSLSLQCEYTDESGRKTTTYIKAGAIRSNSVGKTAEESGSVIFKDGKMYFWNNTQGIMMTFNMSDLAEGVTPAQQQIQEVKENPQDFVKGLEKFKENCREAAVGDSLFTPPSDVKFTDFSKMMEDAQQKAQKSGGGLSEEQIKALQNQYNTQPQDTGSPEE